MEEKDKDIQREEFIELLLKKFPNNEIVTLDNIVKKISLVPSVRSADENRLHYNDYYEISLKDTDCYGVIQVVEGRRHLGAASKELVKKYALKANDILLSYRSSRRITVARVGNDYPTTLVANASTIRIRMKDEAAEDLSILIQAYLNLDFVQEYLLPQKETVSEAQKHKRYLLNTKDLINLPIPNFHIDEQYSFKELYQRRATLKECSIELFNTAKKLKIHTEDLKDDCINTYLNNTQTLPSLANKEKELLNKMKNLLKEMEDLYKVYGIK